MSAPGNVRKDDPAQVLLPIMPSTYGWMCTFCDACEHDVGSFERAKEGLHAHMAEAHGK